MLASSAVSQLRPRISLASGSALVLLTLFLPIGYEACEPARTGIELVQGKGEWPSLLGITSSAAGRGFYVTCLLLAALTLLFVLLSLFRPRTLRSLTLSAGSFRLAATISLFLLVDLFLLIIAIVEGWARLPAYSLAALSCLSPFFFWPRRLGFVWLCIILGWTSLFFLLGCLHAAEGSAPRSASILFDVVVAGIPVGIWYRYSLSRRPALRAQWPEVRLGLAAFYVPAVAGNLWVFAVVVQEHVWGLVPCCVGVHLIALGYMRLAKEGEERRAEIAAT